MNVSPFLAKHIKAAVNSKSIKSSPSFVLKQTDSKEILNQIKSLANKISCDNLLYI